MDKPSSSKEPITATDNGFPFRSPKALPTRQKPKTRNNKNISRSRLAPANKTVLDDRNNNTSSSSLISKKRFNEGLSQTEPYKIIPRFNCQEKIILVVDRAHYKMNKDFAKPLPMLIGAVELFLSYKQGIDMKHEYALVVLNENSALWAVDFTNNIQKIEDCLRNIPSECEPDDIFDLHTLFETILDNVEIPKVKDLNMQPPFVVRTILLLYGRSCTVPVFNSNRHIDNLLNSHYFTLDLIMAYEPADIDNCKEIFKTLQHFLDRKGHSYFFPVGRNLRLLSWSMIKLLGHSLQRPIQSTRARQL